MPFALIRGELTKIHVEALVQVAHEKPLREDSLDGDLHKAPGEWPLAASQRGESLKPGEAKWTKGEGFATPYVIHIQEPRYVDGRRGEEILFWEAYTQALTVAKDLGVSSIAFPLISSGAFGYPKKEALSIALAVLKHHGQKEEDLWIYLVLQEEESFPLSLALKKKVTAYLAQKGFGEEDLFRTSSPTSMPMPMEMAMEPQRKEQGIVKERSLEKLLQEAEETFQEHLFRLMDQRGLEDVAVYKKANMDRKLFSKIRKDKQYQPSKKTAISLAIALSLSLDETEDLLRKAGYALSRSSRFDLIVCYFLEEGNPDLFEINEVLFSFGEDTFGSL